MDAERREHLVRFYSILGNLERKIGGATTWGKAKNGTASNRDNYLGPFAEFDRVWPLAGLTLALVATVSWIGLLGYVAIKLL